MLEHVLRGLRESTIITHRATGLRAVVTVTMDAAEPGADFSVGLDADPEFLRSGSDGWTCLSVTHRWRPDGARYLVAYVQKNRHADLPTVLVDAPFRAFAVRFEVLTPHPHPLLKGRGLRPGGKTEGSHHAGTGTVPAAD